MVQPGQTAPAWPCADSHVHDSLVYSHRASPRLRALVSRAQSVEEVALANEEPLGVSGIRL